MQMYGWVKVSLWGKKVENHPKIIQVLVLIFGGNTLCVFCLYIIYIIKSC